MVNWKVVRLSRHRSPEVLSEHYWYLPAFLWAVCFSLVEMNDSTVDIWRA